MTTTDWRSSAACKSMASELGTFDLFFEPEYEKQAKQICAECDVRMNCLEFAMRGEQGLQQTWEGVFGGMNPKERVRAYRRWLHWTQTRERNEEQWQNWTRQDAG